MASDVFARTEQLHFEYRFNTTDIVCNLGNVGMYQPNAADVVAFHDDAFFQDPVNRMGIPGVEYFAHGYELPPRIAKEFILLGERMPAKRAPIKPWSAVTSSCPPRSAV